MSNVRRSRKICPPCQLLEHFVHTPRPVLRTEVLRGIQGFDAPVHHDGDAVAIFGLVHVVRGDKDGDALVGGAVNKLPEASAGHGVHATRRFIEKDHPRLVEDGDGESQLLLPAQGKGADQRVALGLEAQLAEHLVGLAGDVPLLQAIDAAEEAQVLPHLQVLVEGELLAHVADVPLHLLGPGGDVEARHHARA